MVCSYINRAHECIADSTVTCTRAQVMVAEKSIMRRLEDFPFPPLTCSGGEVTTLAFLHCSLPPLLFLPLPDILSVPLSASPWLSVCLPFSLTLYGYQDVNIKLLTNTLSVHLCFCLFLSHSLPFIPFLSFLCCPCEKKVYRGMWGIIQINCMFRLIIALHFVLS